MATLNEAIRAAKVAAGLDPEKKYTADHFYEHLAEEWRGAFNEMAVGKAFDDLMEPERVISCEECGAQLGMDGPGILRHEEDGGHTLVLTRGEK